MCLNMRDASIIYYRMYLLVGPHPSDQIKQSCESVMHPNRWLEAHIIETNPEN